MIVADVFAGTHVYRFEATDDVDAGFRIGVAEADADGRPVERFSYDNTGRNTPFYREALMLLIRHLAFERVCH